jgi:hypothetical protein
MLPPPGGREGVTLIAAAENYRMTLEKRVSAEPVVLKILSVRIYDSV